MPMQIRLHIVAYSHALKIFKVCRTNYWRQIMVNGWSLERRARQAALIKTWRPWERSTGPTSEAGKAQVAKNAWRGGHRLQLRELARLVNDEVEQARDLTMRLKTGVK